MSEYPLTINSLIDEVADTARGYTRGEEEVTSLVTPIDASVKQFTVSAADSISRGVVEIDDELLFLRAADSTTGVCVVEDWGRGVHGSDPAAHSAGAKVTVAPQFPRARIRAVLAGTLREIYPDIYPVGEAILNAQLAYVNYTLPADTHDVLAVYNKMIGPGAEWVPVKRWRADKFADGVNLMLYSPVSPGTGRVRVAYMKNPPQLDGAVDLTTVGYDSSIRDILVLGATAKLMAFAETSRVELNTVESNDRGVLVPAGSATNVSRALYQMFQKRVDDARRMLLNRYPLQPHNVTR